METVIDPRLAAEVPEANRQVRWQAHRVYDILRSAIRTGSVGHDEKLVEFRIIRSMRESRAVVREALRMLADDGLLVRQRRVGTRLAQEIVRVPMMDELIPIESSPSEGRVVIHQLERKMVVAPDPVRQALAIDAEKVLLLQQLILLDDEPVGVRTSYLCTDEARAARLQSVTGSTHHPLAYGPLFNELYGHDVGRSDFTMEAIPCGARTSRLLGTPKGSPILLVETLLRDATEVPRILCYAHLRGNRLALFVTGATSSA
jgi:DNA-binding GntR family transcriptional regulator